MSKITADYAEHFLGYGLPWWWPRINVSCPGDHSLLLYQHHSRGFQMYVGVRARQWTTGVSSLGQVDERLGVPLNALILVTVVQMLLGIINIGSSAAFVAFVSVGVQALALSYGIP